MEMSESGDMVDFKFLKKAGYKYSELDLAGAGWCMCLPRDGGYLPVPDSEPDTWAPEPISVDVDQVQVQDPLAYSVPEPQQSGPLIGMDEVDNRA